MTKPTLNEQSEMGNLKIRTYIEEGGKRRLLIKDKHKELGFFGWRADLIWKAINTNIRQIK